jgi:hypothetical protein
MKAKSILILFILLAQKTYCQNEIIKKITPGKYNSNNESHNNPYHYEEIILHSDGKFDYFLQKNEFIQIKKKGNWVLHADTLILNEDNPLYKKIMTVKETYDKNIAYGFIKFDVFKFDHNQFKYQISVTHIDTLMTVSNLENPSLIRLQNADSFNISSAEYDYPSYDVKDKRMNHFLVNVSPNPSLVQEKWLIVKGKIRPKGTNGLDAGYYLELTH